MKNEYVKKAKEVASSGKISREEKKQIIKGILRDAELNYDVANDKGVKIMEGALAGIVGITGANLVGTAGLFASKLAEGSVDKGTIFPAMCFSAVAGASLILGYFYARRINAKKQVKTVKEIAESKEVNRTFDDMRREEKGGVRTK